MGNFWDIFRSEGTKDMTSAQFLDRNSKVALGLLDNISPAVLIGERYSLPNGVSSSVWVGPPGTDFTFTDYTVDRISQASSDSASDIGIPLLVTGIDEDWRSIEQIVILNGQSKVALTTELIRINSCLALQNLTGNAYVYEDGTITAGIPDDLTTVKCFIDPVINFMSNAVYSIPGDCIGVIKQFYIQVVPSIAMNLFVDFKATFFEGSTIRSARLPFIDGGNNIAKLDLAIAFSFPPKTDVFIEASPNQPNTGLYFNSSFEIIRQ